MAGGSDDVHHPVSIQLDELLASWLAPARRFRPRASRKKTGLAEIRSTGRDRVDERQLRIVVVGKDERFRARLVSILASAGIDALQASADEPGRVLIKDSAPDMVVIDREVPSDDLEWTERVIRECAMDRRVIMLCELSDRRDSHAARQVGVARYLVKPVSRQQLLLAIREVEQQAHET